MGIIINNSNDYKVICQKCGKPGNLIMVPHYLGSRLESETLELHCECGYNHIYQKYIKPSYSIREVGK